jgi:hypothetical protein
VSKLLGLEQGRNSVAVKDTTSRVEIVANMVQQDVLECLL